MVKSNSLKTVSDGRKFVMTVSRSPGVYLMFDKDDACLYIGKAKNLQSRLISYFHKSNLKGKTKLMVAKIVRIETRITRTESEALLLENNLIKKMKPKYNVVFRVDKSYPYIEVTTNHSYPGVNFYRGRVKKEGTFFGPYANVSAVREILSQIQKIIPVRQCNDSYFRNRSRPCLQYQIKRCTAPCVELIDRDKYAEDVHELMMLLQGRNDSLARSFVHKMEIASRNLHYEDAASYRNKISALRDIEARTYSLLPHDREIDIVVAVENQDTVIVCVMFFRFGQSCGDRQYFFRPLLGEDAEQVISSFLPQFYLKNIIPKEIIVSPLPHSMSALNDLLSRKSEKKIVLKGRVKGRRARVLKTVKTQAEEYLSNYLASAETYRKRFRSLCKDLNHDNATRIECYDISHTGGEATVASQIVYGTDGPEPAQYRRFNLDGINPSDDYDALRETFTRRFTGETNKQGLLPNILIIDGGKGHLRIAHEAIQEYVGVNMALASIAKGPGRNPKEDRVYVYKSGALVEAVITRTSMLLMQELRDEAHRFAITGHRRRRSKARMESSLQKIPGVGI